MQLTAEIFLQIIKSLRSDVSGLSREQRKMPRVGVRGKSSIMIPEKWGTRVYAVSVRDVSANGIGLLMSEPLVGIREEFVLMLPSSGQESKRQMLCVVSRFNKLTSNLYSVGASFKYEISEFKMPAGPTQQISKELLDQADQATVDGLEERLKRLSA